MFILRNTRPIWLIRWITVKITEICASVNKGKFKYFVLVSYWDKISSWNTFMLLSFLILVSYVTEVAIKTGNIYPSWLTSLISLVKINVLDWSFYSVFGIVIWMERIAIKLSTKIYYFYFTQDIYTQTAILISCSRVIYRWHPDIDYQSDRQNWLMTTGNHYKDNSYYLTKLPFI